jgi:hypothetical protein
VVVGFVFFFYILFVPYHAVIVYKDIPYANGYFDEATWTNKWNEINTLQS